MSSLAQVTYLTVPGGPGGPCLDAVVEGQGPLAVVASPHPLMGGEMRNPVVQALARGFRAAGLRSLTFDYRGVGDSEGAPSGDPADAVADYAAAAAAGATVSTLMVASGYSFGAAAAIRFAASAPSFARVVAVAPPAGLLDPADLAHLGARLTLVAAERDTMALAAELGRLAASAGARFELISGADHFLGGQLGRITALAEQAGRALLAPPEV